MRYIVQLALIDDAKLDKIRSLPDWVSSALPEQFSYKSRNATITTYTYEISKPSIVEQNWNYPIYENDNHLLFIGGSVYYRNTQSKIHHKYVPMPREIYDMLVSHGNNIYDHIKGDYYLVLYSKQSRKVQIYVSPFALYPAWYTIDKGVLYVSNILELLVKIKGDINFDNRGLIEFAMFDHCIGGRTIYENVKMFEGGYSYEFVGAAHTKKICYDIADWYHEKPLSMADSLHSIDYNLKKHINEFSKSCNKYQVSLTGGYDGRLNFAYISDNDYNHMNTFSYGMNGSLQIEIPKMVTRKIGATHNAVYLGRDFEDKFSNLGFDTIKMSGGLTPYNRAMYPYAYEQASAFSRNLILGQCDMIRPLSDHQPAGAIYNEFNKSIFFSNNPKEFVNRYNELKKTGFLKASVYQGVSPEEIYNDIYKRYISPYGHFNMKQKFYFFLYKEAMLKFWHTECHMVDLYVNDFISFSDLDYIESLYSSQYCGLYKGIFRSSMITRRTAHNLYVDLMTINNNKLNNLITDRFFSPKWYKYKPLGYFFMYYGKTKQRKYYKQKGNDTFRSAAWSNKFVKAFRQKIDVENDLISISSYDNRDCYMMDNDYRRNRFISLKLWVNYLRA